jgi:hypothetical protein
MHNLHELKAEWFDDWNVLIYPYRMMYKLTLLIIGTHVLENPDRETGRVLSNGYVRYSEVEKAVVIPHRLPNILLLIELREY